MTALYKNVQTYYYLTMKPKTPIAALVAAEIVSILGSRMTYLALPWFVLVTTGSAAKMSLVLAVEILPMAIFGIPSGMVVERLGARTTMLVCDAARAPLLVALPILHAAGRPPLLAPARARLPARLLHGAVLRSAAGDPAGARGRGRDDDRAGEQRHRGRHRLRRPRRPGARRDPDSRSSARRTSSTSTPPRTSSRSCCSPASCRGREAVAGGAARHGVLAGIRFLLARPAARAAERHRDRAQLPRRRAVRDAARTTPTTASRATRRSPGSSSRRSARARCSAASARCSSSSGSRRCKLARARDRRDDAAALAAAARPARLPA